MRKILIRIYKYLRSSVSGTGIGCIYPIKVVHEYILKSLKTDYAEVQGHKMFLDKKDDLDLSLNGVYEPLETDLVKREVKKGDVVVDIGANIGYYTLIFARIVGDRGKVYAFEPDPNNFELLQKNLKANGYNNVVLVQKAVSNKTQRTKLYICESASDQRIYDPGDSRRTIEVESIRLDDYFTGKNRKVDFIKMDTQGADGGVLQGMEALLKENNVKIITEFWPLGLKGFGMEREEFIGLLKKSGFDIYNIDKQKNSIAAADIAELLATYTIEKGNFHTNLFCVKDNSSIIK